MVGTSRCDFPARVAGGTTFWIVVPPLKDCVAACNADGAAHRPYQQKRRTPANMVS
jgi:hypothetical protein